jgi:hypothetical protein
MSLRYSSFQYSYQYSSGLGSYSFDPTVSYSSSSLGDITIGGQDIGQEATDTVGSILDDLIEEGGKTLRAFLGLETESAGSTSGGGGGGSESDGGSDSGADEDQTWTPVDALLVLGGGAALVMSLLFGLEIITDDTD